MAQYIKQQYDTDYLCDTAQVSQISYHDERVIEINYDHIFNKIVVQDNNKYFYLTSPDIMNMTIRNVLQGLGYGDEQAVVTWVSEGIKESVLDTPVSEVNVNTITLYAPEQQIPDVHYEGPLPMIAGESYPV